MGNILEKIRNAVDFICDKFTVVTNCLGKVLDTVIEKIQEGIAFIGEKLVVVKKFLAKAVEILIDKLVNVETETMQMIREAVRVFMELFSKKSTDQGAPTRTDKENIDEILKLAKELENCLNET